RNLSAALAIAALNFTDPDVMIMILVVAMVGLTLLMFIGEEMGKRAAGYNREMSRGGSLHTERDSNGGREPRPRESDR
ncbi:MAG: hypothetical protein M0P22_09305, partial [Methanoculleus sp.]|nr:hypothetical protein [Methanoculleus sp.]